MEKSDFYRVHIQFFILFDKPERFKHLLRLDVERIDMSKALCKSLFGGKHQHLADNRPSDVAVLELFADDDSEFSAVLQTDVTAELAFIGDIEQIAVSIEVIVHPDELFEGVNRVDIIDLLAEHLVLIPRKRGFIGRVVGDEGDVLGDLNEIHGVSQSVR